LLQSLVVRKHRKGKFAVVVGGRRLAALQLLAAAGAIRSLQAGWASKVVVVEGSNK